MDTNTAHRIARQMLDEHGLRDWSIKFNNARSQAGLCNYTRKQLTFSTLLFGKFDTALALNTITHEVAHALCDKAEGHGVGWQRQHKALGGDGLRCWSDPATASATALWKGLCVRDGRQIATRNRLTAAARTRLLCSCHREAVVWRQN